MSVNQEIIETIKNRISVTSLVSRYLPIVQKGNKSWVVCPFHDDKNPSMLLSDDKEMFHCFGCNTSGSIFDFLMLYEHLTFYQALEKLARECNVEIVPDSPEFRTLKGEKEQLYNIYTVLTADYIYQLNEDNPFSIKARNYIEKRKITKKVAEDFRIGYAPIDVNYTANFLTKRNYTQEIIYKSGLFSNEKKYPYFVNRIVFPILDVQGRVIAFSARTLSNDSSVPKYINSSETLIFKKGEILFGFYQSLQSFRQKKPCIVVEGNFDVISLHTLGFTNSVATCGTALTPFHIDLIKRYTNNIILFFDSDEAGTKATVKAIYNVYSAGVKCSVAHLDSYKDVSEALQDGDNGKKAVEKALEQDLVKAESFLFDYFSKKNSDDSISYKSEIIKCFSQFYSLLNHIEQYELIRFLSVKLVLPENIILQALSEDVVVNVSKKPDTNNLGIRPSISGKDVAIASDKKIADDKPLYETDLLKMLAVRRNYFTDDRISYIEYSDLKNVNSRLIFSILSNLNNYDISDDDFVSNISDDYDKRYIKGIIDKYKKMYDEYSADKISIMIDSAVKRIVGRRIRQETRNYVAMSHIENNDFILRDKSEKLKSLSQLNLSYPGRKI